MSQTKFILIAAPSGAGKNSFMERALKDFPVLTDIVTYTTRAIRAGEVDGEAYCFVDRKRFEELIGEGFFVEWSPVHDALYGTPQKHLEEAWAKGKVGIIDIDIQGVDKIKKIYPEATSIFILPPSIEELKKRILARDKKAPANLELRLANAEKEIERAQDFDYRVVNDDFEASYQVFQKILEELL